MKTLLALDIATTTGWAFGPIAEGSKPTLSGAKTLANPKDTDEYCWQETLKWIYGLLLEFSPDLVVIEKPVMTSSMGGASNPRTMFRLAGLQSVIRMVIYMHRRRTAHLLAPGSVRKTFLGMGKLPKGTAKKLVHSRCLELGWANIETTTYDETDALALWAAFACMSSLDFRKSFQVHMPANAARIIAAAQKAEEDRKARREARSVSTVKPNQPQF
jgi:Holliday junction resolvasome RuvABC endonuclease subunit